MFLTTKQDDKEEIIVILQNEMVETMLDIDRDAYEQYVVEGKNGKQWMYVKLSKSMYGTLRAALLYYKKL